MGNRSGARLWIGGLAGVGMLVGHLIAAAAGVDTGASDELVPFVEPSSLHVPAPALAALVAVVVSLLVGSAVDYAQRVPSGSAIGRFTRTVVRLAAVQVMICSAFCAAERLWFGDGLSWAFVQNEGLITIALQLLVAACAALILTFLVRLIVFISRILGKRKRLPFVTALDRARAGFKVPLTPLAGGAGVRGPPCS